MGDSSTSGPDDVDVLAVDASIAQSTGSASYGITDTGFLPKPYARVLAEKLALAKALFGDDVDLASGSAIRKLLEVSALEDARTWGALAQMYDDLFVSTARGDALSRLGEEVAIARPFLEATGTVTLELKTGTSVTLQAGSRLMTKSGHHAYLAQQVVLSQSTTKRDVPVAAFYPGPDHDLDPTKAASDGTFPQKLDRWNPYDVKLETLREIAAELSKQPEDIVSIAHTKPLGGGERRWPDDRYRSLLLLAPRSIYTIDAIRMAVSLVPGVRQVQVRDGYGGLDLNQSIFGYFNFLERVFSGERDVASPYFFNVLVAPTDAAIWAGSDGLEASVAAAIEDLRPIGIFPDIKEAEQVWIGVSANLVIDGLPLPRSKGAIIDDADVVVALKNRLLQRVNAYVERLEFGEPVRAAEVTWAIMSEPGVVDVQNLRLVRFEPSYGSIAPSSVTRGYVAQMYGFGENVKIGAAQIASFVDNAALLKVQ